jgi:hypothetical protein
MVFPNCACVNTVCLGTRQWDAEGKFQNKTDGWQVDENFTICVRWRIKIQSRWRPTILIMLYRGDCYGDRLSTGSSPEVRPEIPEHALAKCAGRALSSDVMSHAGVHVGITSVQSGGHCVLHHCLYALSHCQQAFNILTSTHSFLSV